MAVWITRRSSSLQNKRGFESKFRIQTTAGSIHGSDWGSARHSERAHPQLILGYQSSQVLVYYFYCEINPAWNNKKGWWAGKAAQKYISMLILFSPLHRKMYIYLVDLSSFLYAAILSACINSKRVCRARCTDLSWQMHALKPGRDVIMIRTIVVKNEWELAHRECNWKWWRSWYLKRIQRLTSSTPLHVFEYGCRWERGICLLCVLFACDALMTVRREARARWIKGLCTAAAAARTHQRKWNASNVNIQVSLFPSSGFAWKCIQLSFGSMSLKFPDLNPACKLLDQYWNFLISAVQFDAWNWIWNL